MSRILEPLFLPTYSPASFLSRFLSGKPTQAPNSGFSYQTKIYRTCATNMPFTSLHLCSSRAFRAGVTTQLQHGRRVGEEENTEIRVLSGKTFDSSCRDISVVVSENNSVVKPKCKQCTSLNKMLSNFSKVLMAHISFTAVINNGGIRKGIGGIRNGTKKNYIYVL